MSNAPIGYPTRLDHLRWCANGSIPRYGFLRKVVDAQNHIMAHRRKVFARWGAATPAADVAGAIGTQTIWRFRCRTGYGAARMKFLVGFVPATTGNGGAGQALEIDVVNGGTQTLTITPGDRTGSATWSPDDLIIRTHFAEVDPNTVYSVAVRKLNGCRPVLFLAYEDADRAIDGSVDYFHELEPGIGEPVYDSVRDRLLKLALIWKVNGSQLLTWPGTRDGTSPTVASTTWTNVIDSATSVSASTAGFYLGDGSITLEEWCRLSDNKTIDVVLAAHGSVNTGVGNGEVRLQNSGGTLCSITGITTTPGWFTTTTTISALDTVSKADLQFRTAVGNTITLNAVSMYAYLA